MRPLATSLLQQLVVLDAILIIIIRPHRMHRVDAAYW